MANIKLQDSNFHLASLHTNDRMTTLTKPERGRSHLVSSYTDGDLYALVSNKSPESKFYHMLSLCYPYSKYGNLAIFERLETLVFHAPLSRKARGESRCLRGSLKANFDRYDYLVPGEFLMSKHEYDYSFRETG